MVYYKGEIIGSFVLLFCSSYGCWFAVRFEGRVLLWVGWLVSVEVFLGELDVSGSFRRERRTTYGGLLH
jgi:hypothetical protein